jgi:ribonuclease HI
MLTLLCFSKAVWRSRWTFRDNQVAPQITAVSTTIASWFQRYLRSTDFQQHGRRDKASEAKCFNELLQSLPAGHLVFTDGSAFKVRNAQGEEFPGPAGAGAIFYIRGENCPRYRSKSIGVGTNNLAEVEAVLLMASELVENPPGDTLPIYVFIDNRTAIAVSTGRTRPAWCDQQARAIHDNLICIARTNRVHFFWVPGHAEVEGNELADRLAKRGAAGFTSRAPISITDEFRPPSDQLTCSNMSLPKHYIRLLPLGKKYKKTRKRTKLKRRRSQAPAASSHTRVRKNTQNVQIRTILISSATNLPALQTSS